MSPWICRTLKCLVVALVAITAPGCVRRLVDFEPNRSIKDEPAEIAAALVEISEQEPPQPYEELGELVVREGRDFSMPIEESAMKLLRESAAERGCEHVWIRSINRAVERSILDPTDATVSSIKIRATCTRTITAAHPQ